MKNIQITSTPYDDVFRTLLSDCSPLIIPVINEIFGEHYSGREKITFSPNEHFLKQQDGNEEKRITDTSFRIEGKETKKYHLECQSSTDNSMLVRFFEYDTQIALDGGEIKGNILTVTLPHSAVLFLRHHASTPDSLKIRMVTPGGTVEYDIHVIKSQQYTLEKIFEKNLLLLIPFYIFSHEAQFEEYEKDKAKLKLLQAEYEGIKNKLEELSATGTISEYTRCTIMDMSNKVLEHIALKYNSVKEGVKAVMGGKVLEYEAKAIKREGIEQGIEQGIVQGITGTVSILKNLDIPPQTILAKIQEQYNLSPEAAKKYL
ncbi:MAG: hypothetical protein HFG42_08010 [Lachnospiraceae bacterium]|jgi:hypothetical protein|nr:hypothetical protein [Lachnospiraceae bacterium]